MGRRKLEIKPIEGKSARQVTFSKRRNGLFNKARQLSSVCDASVAVILFSSSGKLYNFSSGDSLAQILNRYQSQHVDGLKSSDEQSGYQNYLSHKELLEIVESQLEEPNVANTSVGELIELEQELESALSVTRARKTQLMMESVRALEEKDKLLREANQHLAMTSQIGGSVNVETGADGKEMMPDNNSGNNQLAATSRQPKTLSLLI